MGKRHLPTAFPLSRLFTLSDVGLPMIDLGRGPLTASGLRACPDESDQFFPVGWAFPPSPGSLAARLHLGIQLSKFAAIPLRLGASVDNDFTPGPGFLSRNFFPDVERLRSLSGFGAFRSFLYVGTGRLTEACDPNSVRPTRTRS